MFERAYRQRLESDLARWQSDGVITAAAGDAIRATLSPLPAGITVAVIVAVVGGLLIAAAFLAFIAANWTAIARPARFAIVLAGIAGAYVVAAFFDARRRAHLSDLAVTVGSLVFGAAIALVGQMYHLGADFAGGLLLWALGALAAAVLTGSRGALAVALVVASGWSGMRVFEAADLHLPFLGFLLVGAALAVAWNAPAARHLVAIAAVDWVIDSTIGIGLSRYANPGFTVCAGAALLLGGGLALAQVGADSMRNLGLVLSTYGAFLLALSMSAIVVISEPVFESPLAMALAGGAGVLLALAAAAMDRRITTGLVGAASALALAAAASIRPVGGEPWLAYALALAAMLCLVISGQLDDKRPRLVAGWIGLAGVIAAITWSVQASLLQRALFLAVAGVAAVALAVLLGRMVRVERVQ
jgi:uncharacterized membrane protein